MREGKPRVRFAPSPTGELHVGNARTALFNWLFARRYDGVFVLRIEDTDQARSDKAFEENLINDLRWLGLDWDEGPDTGGPCAPYRQMERLDLYRGYLEKLAAAGLAYPCYCSEEELDADRAALMARGAAPRYSGRCRALTAEGRRKLEAEGRKPAFRFRIEGGPILFRDLIRGSLRFEGEALGDFIIVRSAGIPAYNFAVVVDDHHMGITHVIRGEDHLSNTAIQILLYRALGFDMPLFAHHALILGRDRTKLGKRHGAVSVHEFRDMGILPEALMNYLALLGSSFGDGKEIRSREEIVGAFSLARAGKSGANFDAGKLRWLNSWYIRQDRTDKLVERIRHFAEIAGYAPAAFDPAWLRGVVEAARDNMTTLADIGAYLAMFLEEGWEPSREAKEILQGEDARLVVRNLYESLGREGIGYTDAIREVGDKTGFRGKKLLMPVRAAVTGRTEGPELAKVFSLLGRLPARRRIEKILREGEQNGRS